MLLIPVHIPPFFHDRRGLPGGLIKPDETAEDSAFRHIKHKTGLPISSIEQLGAFSEIDRDPRGRVVSIAYIALLSEEEATHTPLREGAVWMPVSRAVKLAYDHDKILKQALATLRAELWHSKLTPFLLPKKFTLSEMQHAFDLVLGTTSDKRNFRKKVASLDLVKKVPGKKLEGAHRPADLYAFKHG